MQGQASDAAVKTLLGFVALLPISLPTNAHLGRAAGDGSSSWLPATHMGDLDAILASWLQPDLAVAIAGI